MAIFKCKMCGGTIEFEEGATVGVCDSCGTKQTLPKTNDEAIKNLFNRATNLRLKCEFDKAEQIYERIVQQDDSEAEAHWGIVLCKYGIEYVEDPKTFTRIPTCHRTLFEAVTTDPDYIAAIDYSDASQQAIYEAEARAIDKIQKDILAIVKNEKPFDVFICYKETDEDGKRTIDSTIANDIYYQLTQEGFKVFYAAITLEDKLGKEYEPYIFAALNSSKVMLVLGTKPEYFSAVWVKNEWSRFMNFMKTDRSKLLIPCYRDMDAYDLPEEFAHLQAQDMSKIGFINDVVRGIKKVVNKEETQETVKETVVVNNTASSNTEPLLKRAFMFLEDGKWSDADEYCEKVLDLDPENSRAYLGKLMAELNVRKESNLRDTVLPFDGSDNYQKAYRFADDTMKAKLEGDIKFINDRNENARKQSIYDKAKALVKDNIQSLNESISLFNQISGWKDVDIQIENCKKKIEEIKEKNEIARKDDIYSRAANKSRESIAAVEQAIELYKQIPGWKDADSQLEIANTKLAELNAKKEEERIVAAKARKKAMKIIAVVGPVVAAVIVFVVVLVNVIIPNSKYNSAMELYELGKYSKAAEVFENLGDFKESKAMLGKIDKIHTYERAKKYYDSGMYKEAKEYFEKIKNYADASEWAKKAEKKLKEESMKNAKVGDVIYFGKKDGTLISWEVLDKQEDKILVITKKAIGNKQYNTSNAYVTWENCSLRTWLNNELYSEIFDADEKAIILETRVVNKDNPNYGTNGGNDTTDKLFLLSIDEATRFFKTDDERICMYKGETCWWWLRSPGHRASTAARVGQLGSIDSTGNISLEFSDLFYGVRPAMWITLD